MKKASKIVAAMATIALAASMMVGCGSSTPAPAAPAAAETEAEASADDIAYPEKDVNASIMWSAGGVCDLTSRAIGAAAQDILGKTIIFENRPGAGGSVSTTYVNSQDANGYELLFGAENPQIAKVMGTAEIDYDDFTPINIYCTSVASICVSKDSPYETVEDLFNDVLAKPGQVVMATTGAGGLPQTVASMCNAVLGTEPNMVPFDGENECMTAIIGGNADYSIATLGSTSSFYQSGDIKILAMVADEPVPGYEEVPIITDTYDGFATYLPWGPFYGVFVKNGTDAAIVEKLEAVFAEAAQDEEFLELLANKGCVPLGISGQEAVDYLAKYKAVTSYLLYDSGATEIDPASVGIERP